MTIFQQIQLILKKLDILKKLFGLQTQLEKMQIEEMVRRVAKDYKVDADTLVAVIWAESGMNPRAILKNTNGTTDFGLCQFKSYCLE